MVFNTKQSGFWYGRYIKTSRLSRVKRLGYVARRKDAIFMEGWLTTTTMSFSETFSLHVSTSNIGLPGKHEILLHHSLPPNNWGHTHITSKLGPHAHLSHLGGVHRPICHIQVGWFTDAQCSWTSHLAKCSLNERDTSRRHSPHTAFTLGSSIKCYNHLE